MAETSFHTASVIIFGALIIGVMSSPVVSEDGLKHSVSSNASDTNNLTTGGSSAHKTIKKDQISISTPASLLMNNSSSEWAQHKDVVKHPKYLNKGFSFEHVSDGFLSRMMVVMVLVMITASVFILVGAIGSRRKRLRDAKGSFGEKEKLAGFGILYPDSDSDDEDEVSVFDATQHKLLNSKHQSYKPIPSKI